MAHAPAFLALIDSVHGTVRDVTVEETRKRLSDAPDLHLVDVREDSEWTAGHIQGATHIGKGVIERDIEATIPDRDAEIILYCGGGFRSVLAADAIQKMGYTNVASMAGGWRDWTASGAPTAT
ncbi:MAG: rhodanese-like domain-containing protein [Gemmatimonadota bacterium]|nr:rhodanese-like domain-containing protein [Gemmatimonadota bacterium]